MRDRETEGGCFTGLVGWLQVLLGSRLLSHAISLIRAPDFYLVVVDWRKGQVRGCGAKQVR